MRLKHQLDRFPYQLMVIILLLVIGSVLAFLKDWLVISVLVALLNIILVFALLGWFVAPKKLEMAVLTFLKSNGGQADREKIENLFIKNSQNEVENPIQIANEIIKRLERKNKISIKENIIKTNV